MLFHSRFIKPCTKRYLIDSKCRTHFRATSFELWIFKWINGTLLSREIWIGLESIGSYKLILYILNLYTLNLGYIGNEFGRNRLKKEEVPLIFEQAKNVDCMQHWCRERFFFLSIRFVSLSVVWLLVASNRFGIYDLIGGFASFGVFDLVSLICSIETSLIINQACRLQIKLTRFVSNWWIRITWESIYLNDCQHLLVLIESQYRLRLQD